MSADIQLKWEWPAGRAVEDRLLVRVDSVKSKGGGLFGLNRTPSFAENIPDPTVLAGVIENRDSSIRGKTVTVAVPKQEMPPVNPGDYAVLGIIGTDVCVCVVPVESPDVDVASIDCP